MPSHAFLAPSRRYVLLAAVNDQPAHADALAAMLLGIGAASRFHVNLIPYNAQSGVPVYDAPSHEACKAFKTALKAPPHGRPHNDVESLSYRQLLNPQPRVRVPRMR